VSNRLVNSLPPVFATSGVVAEQRFAIIGHLPLTSGGVIDDCRIGYRTYGELAENKSNVLVIPTWFAGTTADLESDGLIGPGLLADTDKYFVVAIDALGNGVSSSPSNSRTGNRNGFPVISIEDMVNSQHELLTGQLGIEHVSVVTGSSMGGMQTFRWMTQYPDFMDNAVPIDGTPRMTSYDLLQWQTHKDIIRALQRGGHNDTEIIDVISRLELLTLYTPDFFLESVPVANLPTLIEQSEQAYSGYSADDYVSQLEAMIDHDVLGPGDASAHAFAKRVKANVLMVSVPSDHMVNPVPAKQLAPTIGAEYLEIESNCGHMGSTCENDMVIAEVTRFLSDQR
jgi:homoserine O-acetyltransferase